MPNPSPPPLGIPVPIMGITGEVYCGKTILALSIAPGVHPEGHPFAGKSRSMYIDFEQSGASYAGAGAHRVDAPAELRVKHGARAYQPVDVFTYFRAFIQTIPANCYDTIIVDPITDVEDGLVDYVRANPAEFGYTKEQFASASGLMWGAVKNLWKMILIDLSARAHMFIFVSHMRMEFANGKPTKRLIPKGKETLAEIAALYLRLERDTNRDGDKPQPPSAIIIKERLSVTKVNEKTGELEVVKMLPDRLPIATAKALRHYIEHPVGNRKLKPEELVLEPTLSDDDKLVLQAEIEKNKADAAAKQVELWNLQKAQQVMGQIPGAAALPPSSAPPPAAPATVVASPASVTHQVPNDPELVAAIGECRSLAIALYGSPPKAMEAFAEFFAKEGLKSLTDMTVVQALSFKHRLKSDTAKANLAAKGTQPDPTQGQPLPASENAAPVEPFKGKEPMEPDQFEQLKALCNPQAEGGMSNSEQEAWKEHFKVERLRDLTQEQYQFLMTRRSERLAKPATAGST